MIPYEYLRDLAHNTSWTALYFWHVIGFSLLYFSHCPFFYWLTRFFFPNRKIGRLIDTRPLKKDQISFEMRHSFGAILIQSFFGVLALKMDKAGIIEIRWQGTGWVAFLDLGLFLIWNEVYFYLIHTLFHTRWLFKKSHYVHHYSVTPTPFTTFSFHWLESVAFGFTMISTMIWYDYSILAVILFPYAFFLLNTIGHYNFTFFPNRTLGHYTSASWRHGLHHGRVSGNFAFWSPNLDRIFKTRIHTVSYHEPLNNKETER